MAVQEYVPGEDFKKLIEDKLISSISLKHVLKKKGIMPICIANDKLADLTYRMLLGSETMSQIREIMNFDQNNLKATMLVITPASVNEGESFTEVLADAFVEIQRIPCSKYKLKNIKRDTSEISLQYCYQKPQKGRVSIASSVDVTLNVNISPLDDGQYKVSIHHEGASDAKQFLSLLEGMLHRENTEKVFSLKRVTLARLLKANKVDFFDKIGSTTYKEWRIVDITNVTVNKGDKFTDEESEDISEEITENEPAGKLTGIRSAILSGGGLRNNEFVKECMFQGFIFSSMRYKFQHRTQPTIIEIEVNLKQIDLKISITKTYKTEDDGKDHISPLSHDEQNSIIDFFQNEAYRIYEALIEKQRKAYEELEVGRKKV